MLSWVSRLQITHPPPWKNITTRMRTVAFGRVHPRADHAVAHRNADAADGPDGDLLARQDGQSLGRGSCFGHRQGVNGWISFGRHRLQQAFYLRVKCHGSPSMSLGGCVMCAGHRCRRGHHARLANSSSTTARTVDPGEDAHRPTSPATEPRDR